jgi:hypothetical protein
MAGNAQRLFGVGGIESVAALLSDRIHGLVYLLSLALHGLPQPCYMPVWIEFRRGKNAPKQCRNERYRQIADEFIPLPTSKAGAWPLARYSETKARTD